MVHLCIIKAKANVSIGFNDIFETMCVGIEGRLPCSQNGKRPCIRKEQYCLTGININDIAGTFQRSC